MHIPPNWGTFAVLIVSFLVFWFIFSRLFFRPFLDLLSQREKRFRSLSERTEQLLKDAREADQGREQRLAATRREALERREVERRRIETQAAQMLETAKSDARATLEEARTRIEGELKAAELELDQMGRSLAAELAERVLGRPLNGTGTSH
jgi:F0F1-type ATP synthase membrane subunit b/b'